jgi:uncharacterized membrane protein YozB (DUF420 family)
MDAKALYWTGALVNLGVILALAVRGVLQVRRGEIEAHRRSMLTGAFLIVAFVVSYALKLALLGREDLSTWSAAHVNNLRVHETCVAVMIVAGVVALDRARRMSGKRERTRNPGDEPAPAATVAWHHRAGWTSVAGALAGFLTAAVILLGMYSRL